MLFYGVHGGNADTQTQNSIEDTVNVGQTEEINSTSGVGARVRARLESENIHIDAETRDRNGFYDVRRMFSDLSVRLRIGLVLMPALTFFKVISLLRTRKRPTTQASSANQANTSNESLNALGSGSTKLVKRVRFNEEQNEGFIYEPEEDYTKRSYTDVELLSDEESAVDMEEFEALNGWDTHETSGSSSSRQSELANSFNTYNDHHQQLFSAHREERLSATDIIDDVCGGTANNLLVSRPDLGEGFFSVPNTQLILQENVSFQEASVYMFLRDTYQWLLMKEATYQNRPNSLNLCTKSDCNTMLDNRDLLLKVIPRVYAIRQKSNGDILAVLEDCTGGMNKTLLFDVELGSERYNLQELNVHHHNGSIFSSLRLKILSMFGRSGGGDSYRVIRTSSGQPSGIPGIFSSSGISSSSARSSAQTLEQRLSLLSSAQLSSLQQQIMDIQTGMAVLPVSGWGIRLRFILPDHDDITTDPKVTLVSFAHAVLSSEADPSLGDEAISKGILAKARGNLHEGLTSVISTLLNIQPRN